MILEDLGILQIMQTDLRDIAERLDAINRRVNGGNQNAHPDEEPVDAGVRTTVVAFELSEIRQSFARKLSAIRSELVCLEDSLGLAESDPKTLTEKEYLSGVSSVAETLRTGR